MKKIIIIIIKAQFNKLMPVFYVSVLSVDVKMTL